MKRLLIAIIAIVLMGIGVSAQNPQNNENRSELLAHLSSLPEVSVTYLSKSMLQKLPKDKTESLLGFLVSKGGVSSIRVFELGNAEAETVGKKLLNSYISESRGSEPELLMLQNNTSNEVLIYGIPYINDIYKYNRLIMYSKQQGKKAVLIILSGAIPESSIGQLIESFSE